MKAIVCEKFGSPEVLELKEVEQPEPKEDEVLIRNYASSINTVDVFYRSGKPPKVIFWTAKKIIGPLMRIADSGIRKPKRKIPGLDFAGEIVAFGKEVTNWKKGDEVYGYSNAGGACAEYLSVSASSEKLTKKPSNMSFQEAGAVPGGAPPALLGLRDIANLKKDQRILIIGASGGIGTYAVQIAKHVYEANVTAVCGPNNIDLMKEIGADNVIDYTKEDYTKNGQKYDIIFDAVGANTFSRCKKILSKNGVYVSNNFMNSKKHLIQIMTSKFTRKKLKGGVADENAENLSVLRDWIEEGKIKSVIDTVYPLNQAAEAHKRYETGHAKGRVVISID